MSSADSASRAAVQQLVEQPEDTAIGSQADPPPARPVIQALRLQQEYDDELLVLWDALAPKVFGVLRGEGADSHTAEELTQEVFLVMRCKWPMLRSSEWPGSYAYKTARLMWKWERARRLKTVEAERLHIPDSTAVQSDTEAVLDTRRALSQMPRRQAQALYLRHGHDMSVKDTAQTLHVGENSVKRYTHDGLDDLREGLADYNGRKDGSDAHGA